MYDILRLYWNQWRVQAAPGDLRYERRERHDHLSPECTGEIYLGLLRSHRTSRSVMGATPRCSLDAAGGASKSRWRDTYKLRGILIRI